MPEIGEIVDGKVQITENAQTTTNKNMEKVI
jgi:hypothetical protein